MVFAGDRTQLALEAARLRQESSGRPLETVFLDRVARDRVTRRLTTVASEAS